MRRAATIFCAALFIALPTVSHAQYNDTDLQNPTEYHDEDSQPLALFADVIYPVGFAIEWLVARPMHYVADESPAAPIFRPVSGGDGTPPPRIPIIPDNTMEDEEAAATEPQEWTPTRSAVTTNATVIKQASPSFAAPPSAAPSSAAPSSGQPVLH